MIARGIEYPSRPSPSRLDRSASSRAALRTSKLCIFGRREGFCHEDTSYNQEWLVQGESKRISEGSDGKLESPMGSMAPGKICSHPRLRGVIQSRLKPKSAY